MSYFSFLAQNGRWLLGGFLLTFFSSFGQTFFISLIRWCNSRGVWSFQRRVWIDLHACNVGKCAYICHFLGKIVDFISVAKSVLIVIPALSIASLVMGVSQSIILLVVVLYCLRLFGQGMMTHISLTAMGKWYSQHRGRAVSIAVVGHQAGEALLPIIYSATLIWFSWRETWSISAAFLMFVALPSIYLLMKIERVPSDLEISDAAKLTVKSWTRAEVLQDAYFWAMLIAVLAPSFIGTTLFFHQDYLLELRGWDKLEFSLSFTVMAFLTFIFALIAGQLVDRFSAVSMLPFFLLPLSAACIAMWALESISGSYVFMGLLGVSYGFSSTLFGALWPEIYGTKYLGAVRSIIIAMMVFGTAVGPGLTGYLIDIGVSYPLQIFTMGIYCLAASAIMLFVSRKLTARRLADS